jgi:ribosomal protein L22
MADETPELDDQAQTAEPAKPPRRRAAAAAADPAPEGAAAKPARARRRPKASDEETAAAETAAKEETAKPRRPRVRAKAAEEESAAGAAPKPRRSRARAAGAEEDAVKAPAELPAPKPPASRTAKKPAAPSRRLVPGRGRAPRDDGARAPQLVYAQARYVRSSARKARIVCDHIRGKSVPEARAILAFAPRGVAKDWSKLLASAVANAEHNHELIGDELHVREVFADVGPTLKRFRPRAMGRATPINKRTAHLSITLGPKE